MAQENSNTWFGVSMFLLGLIAGGALTVSMTGGFSPKLPSPTAPDGPTAPSDEAPPAFSVRVEKALAAVPNLDRGKYDECIGSKKYDEKITSQMSTGQSEGVSGTPGNILLHLPTNTAWVVSGAQPIENFEAAIDAMLKDPKAVPPAGVEIAPKTPVLNFNADHIRGNRDGSIALIEYSDYECPFCTRVHPTHKALIESYDELMWVYRHFPLSFHPNAMPAAVSSECIAELAGEDAFWTFTDGIFEG